MSYKVRKLVVGKGRTLSDEQNGEWSKEYYELEIDIPDEHELSAAKENAEGLLNEWLGITQPAGVQKKQEKSRYDMSKIRWEQAQGTSGPYEKSSDVDNLDFKSLLKDVQAHTGKMTVGDYFVWVFKNGQTIGRKKHQK
jgi:hypothetical protein